uniref:Uncharacterized protein n=1 Tax=Sphaerodactylus townsendi TaxID=933632 RepID=A0ACB8FNI5_9SAUR
MEAGAAYGAGKAGGAFDPQTFIRQPHTILRMVSWLSWEKVAYLVGEGCSARDILAMAAYVLVAYVRRSLGLRQQAANLEAREGFVS